MEKRRRADDNGTHHVFAHTGSAADFADDCAYVARATQHADEHSTVERRRLRAGGTSMARLGRALARREALVLRDVPGDGDCVVHSMLPALARRAGRPLSVVEARAMLVFALERAQMRPYVEQDYRQTLADELRSSDDEPASVDEHVARMRRRGTFLPPLLCARALAWWTGERVRVWGIAARSTEPIALFESDGDGPFSVELAYDEAGAHMARLLPTRHEATLRNARRSVLDDIAARKRARVGGE